MITVSVGGCFFGSMLVCIKFTSTLTDSNSQRQIRILWDEDTDIIRRDATSNCS